MKPWWVIWLALCCLPAFAATESTHPDPADTISGFHSVLILALKEPAYEARLEIIGPEIDSRFSLQTIARISLGRHWRGLSDIEQESVVTALRELVTTTYAARFNAWNQQQFETLETRALPRNRARVATRLTTPEDTVSLDYQLVLTDNHWRIYDIVAGGVSDLALKRASYAELFEQGGLNAVLEEITHAATGNRP